MPLWSCTAKRGLPPLQVTSTCTSPPPPPDWWNVTDASVAGPPRISSICQPTAGEALRLTAVPLHVPARKPPRVVILRDGSGVGAGVVGALVLGRGPGVPWWPSSEVGPPVGRELPPEPPEVGLPWLVPGVRLEFPVLGLLVVLSELG